MQSRCGFGEEGENSKLSLLWQNASSIAMYKGGKNLFYTGPTDPKIAYSAYLFIDKYVFTVYVCWWMVSVASLKI